MKKNDKKIDKKEILENTIEELKQRFGEGSIMKLGEVRRVDVGRWRNTSRKNY